jgi:hypothetical protein
MSELISTTIVSALARATMKALITGQAPNPDDYASAANSILGALLDNQGAIAETLNRIEKKLDALGQQSFRVTFGAGRDFLGAAQRVIDRAYKGEDQQSNLADARSDLVPPTGR